MTHYEMMDAHFLTIFTVTAGMLLAPMYILATYHFSGASTRKAMLISSAWLLWGAFMTWVSLAQIPRAAGPIGGLIVPLCWLTPSIILYVFRDWFLEDPLSQRWLVGLQIFRLIGGVFLIEYARHNLPGIFALPAGVGDVLVGITAIIVILTYGRRKLMPHFAVITVLVLGALDFMSAFFFGFFSTSGEVQLFYPDIENNVLMYPTGLIPLFLVPYAIFFHTLSFLSLRRSAAIAQSSGAHAH